MRSVTLQLSGGIIAQVKIFRIILKATSIQTGKTPKEFSAGINIPSSGTLYFRAHAIVDGSDIYSPENQISIIQQTVARILICQKIILLKKPWKQ